MYYNKNNNMKKVILILLIGIGFFSCQTDPIEENVNTNELVGVWTKQFNEDLDMELEFKDDTRFSIYLVGERVGGRMEFHRGFYEVQDNVLVRTYFSVVGQNSNVDVRKESFEVDGNILTINESIYTKL